MSEINLANLPSSKPIGPKAEQWLGDNSVSQDLKDAWINDGFSILRGAYSPEEIARYNSIVTQARSTLDDGKDEYGYGDRIGQLHQKHPELLNLASAPSIINFIKWAFNDDPVVFGSLNFDKGTQQDAHIDAIFFWPEPCYSMCGCWIALEDIHLDAGPLFYVPKSHTWPFYHSQDVVSSRPDLVAKRNAARNPDFPANERGAIVGEIGRFWTKDFHKLEKINNSERAPIALRAGDAVFWHSLLAHGGMPRINPALSRKSVVFHYIGKNTKLYTFEQFMLYDKAKLTQQHPQPMNLRQYGDIEYMHYGHFVTYNAGGQVIHPLTDA